MIHLSQALKNLTDNKYSYYLGEDPKTIVWKDPAQTPPTEEEIQVEMDRLQAEYDSLAYSRNRASATGYPSIPDQLDEIYHNGIDSWKAVIKVTKDKYPK